MKKRTKLFLGLIPVCVAALSLGFVYAKFFTEDKQSATVETGRFYFTSDKLDAEQATYTLRPNAGSFAFTLKNHADGLRYSEVDIPYRVTVDGSATVSASEGVLNAGENQDAVITVGGLEAGNTYLVTATSIAPYRHTISAKLVVGGTDDNVYHSVQDYRVYTLVTVSTTDYAGKITLIYPTGLIPDNTDPLLSDATTVQGYVVVTVERYFQHTFRFLKDTDNTYSELDFTVTKGATGGTV